MDRATDRVSQKCRAGSPNENTIPISNPFAQCGLEFCKTATVCAFRGHSFGGDISLQPTHTSLGPIATAAIADHFGPLLLSEFTKLMRPHDVSAGCLGHAFGQPIMTFSISEGFHGRSSDLFTSPNLAIQGVACFDTDQAPNCPRNSRKSCVFRQ